MSDGPLDELLKTGRSSRDRATAIRYALHDWIPHQAQFLLDEANGHTKTDPSWGVEDDFAGHCEELAEVARFLANLGRLLDGPPGETPDV